MLYITVNPFHNAVGNYNGWVKMENLIALNFSGVNNPACRIVLREEGYKGTYEKIVV